MTWCCISITMIDSFRANLVQLFPDWESIWVTTVPFSVQSLQHTSKWVPFNWKSQSIWQARSSISEWLKSRYLKELEQLLSSIRTKSVMASWFISTHFKPLSARVFKCCPAPMAPSLSWKSKSTSSETDFETWISRSFDARSRLSKKHSSARELSWNIRGLSSLKTLKIRGYLMYRFDVIFRNRKFMLTIAMGLGGKRCFGSIWSQEVPFLNLWGTITFP